MINIKIQFQTYYGKALYLIGDSSILGQWDTQQAIQLKWTQGDLWECEIPLHNFEYKYFVADYDQIQNVQWEHGPNRHFEYTKSVDILDFWNHRNIHFQCCNPHQLNIFISGSCNELGNYYKRISMKYKNGISYFRISVNVLEDQVIYYQFHVKAKREYTSTVQILKLKDQNFYSKNNIIAYCDGLKRIKSTIYQLDPNICYGYVPSDHQDFNVLQQANLKTIVEFCNDPDPLSVHYQKKKDNFNYMVVNLNIFNETNLLQRLFNFIQVLISQYKTIYICNNSLSHLKKYLQVYQKVLCAKS